MTDAPQQPPRKRAKTLKIAALAVLGVFAAYQLVTFAWTRSGSNEWTLAGDDDGIRVWTRKTPGEKLVKVKAQMRTKARLSSVIAILEETEVLDKTIGIDKVNVLERKDTPALYMAYHHYVHHMPQPIGAREFIIQTHHSQDPQTHKVEVNVLAAPNKLPPVDGLARINHLNNIWTLTPLPGGELELSMIVDVDLGGSLPYFLNNAIVPQGIRELFKSIRKLSTQDRYRNATVSHIVELDDAPATKLSSADRVAP
jgi:hypothetical protein